MKHDDGLRVRRTRRTYDALELEALEDDMEAHGAYVSPGRGYWRGLSGHDPLDDIPDEEFGLQRFEDWEDGALDEKDRPNRRRPSGREVDIVPPVASPVTVRVDPAIAAAFAARQAQAQEGPTWVVDGGRVTVEGSFKVWRGACAQCAVEFEQRRPGSQRRKWRTTCGEECAKALDRAKARDRMRARRSDAA